MELCHTRCRPSRRIASPFRVASPRVRSGARAGWDDFVDVYALPLRHLVSRTLTHLGESPSREEVDDLMQDAFCRLLDGGPARLAELSGSRFPQVVNYLERLVRSVAIDHWRASRARKRGFGCLVRPPLGGQPIAERVIDWTSNPEERLLAAELLRLTLARALAATPGGRKRRRNTAIVWRALIGGWTSREISLHFTPALSVSAIDTVLSRVRKRLGVARPFRRGLEPPYRRGASGRPGCRRETV